LTGWPATLTHGEVTLRPLGPSDARAWRDARVRNAAWLRPWDATVPPGSPQRPASFRSLVRRLTRLARDGQAMPFALDVGGEFAGQVTVNNIVRGSAQFASIGYWLDQRFAGRGVVPLAVAMTIDHCFFTAGLHRVEIAIRPENTNSLRVVEKLGIPQCGMASRYLHIDGEWRDHLLFGITIEEAGDGLVKRLTT
jgi:ribosomal-protein-alanine N-acetyltransferase